MKLKHNVTEIYLKCQFSGSLAKSQRHNRTSPICTDFKVLPLKEQQLNKLIINHKTIKSGSGLLTSICNMISFSYQLNGNCVVLIAVSFPQSVLECLQMRKTMIKFFLILAQVQMGNSIFCTRTKAVAGNLAFWSFWEIQDLY